MNRGDGLVQRRRVANSGSGGGNGGGGAGGGGSGHGQDGANADVTSHNDKLSGQSPDMDCSSQKDLNCNPTIDEDSDKETRLTLMEEVLLLGLKDKEVLFTFYLRRFRSSSGVCSSVIELIFLYRGTLPSGMIASVPD